MLYCVCYVHTEVVFFLENLVNKAILCFSRKIDKFVRSKFEFTFAKNPLDSPSDILSE